MIFHLFEEKTKLWVNAHNMINFKKNSVGKDVEDRHKIMVLLETRVHGEQGGTFYFIPFSIV